MTSANWSFRVGSLLTKHLRLYQIKQQTVTKLKLQTAGICSAAWGIPAIFRHHQKCRSTDILCYVARSCSNHKSNNGGDDSGEVLTSKTDSSTTAKRKWRPIIIDKNAKHTQNTQITILRAMNDYLLTLEDVKDLRQIKIRSAYNEEVSSEMCYLKSDIEKRAVEKWGSMQKLDLELRKIRVKLDDDERERRILSAFMAHLKKRVKEQEKLNQEHQLFGSQEERMSQVKGSAKVVIYAILSNVTVMCFKLLAYLWTGSASMLSEWVHSLADIANQCLLLYGIFYSLRRPSIDHPYGFSRARYVYALISGVGIFCVGAGVNIYHGISLLMHPHQLESLLVAYSVLAGSLIVEGVTLKVAFDQAKKNAEEAGLTVKEYVLRGREPNVVAVLLEDSIAVAGVSLAGICLALTSLTGNSIYDAAGCIAIGGMLGAMALFLIQRNGDALVGKSIPPNRLRQIVELMENDVMIRSIHDVKATELGADTVRFKAEINFDGREVTRSYVSNLDMENLLLDVQQIKTVEELNEFLLNHGDRIIDSLGVEVDRIEKNIKKASPEVRHVDLEIL